jgi:hypothetical protein
LHLVGRICESIAGIDEKIVITALLEDSSIVSWYARPKTPVPNGKRQAAMAIQAQLVTSIVRNNEDYLGKVDFAMVRQEMADAFLFPIHGKKRRIFCMVVARPYDLDGLVAKVDRFLVRD